MILVENVQIKFQFIFVLGKWNPTIKSGDAERKREHWCIRIIKWIFRFNIFFSLIYLFAVKPA